MAEHGLPVDLVTWSGAFVPAGNKPRAAWETDRRAKLGKKGEIKVQLGTPSIKADGEVVLVSFEQRYQSGNYSDVVQKQLEWVKEGGDWKIDHLHSSAMPEAVAKP